MKKATLRFSRLVAALALAGMASHTLAADTLKIGLAGPKTVRSPSTVTWSSLVPRWPSSRSTRPAASRASSSKA